MAEQEEKTENATPKRRGEARSEGQVAKSSELNSVVILLAGFCTLYLLRWHYYESLSQSLTVMIQEMTRTAMTVANISHYAWVGAFFLTKLLGPTLLVLLLAGVGINLVQVGFLWTFKPLEPKLDKLNPIKGIAGLFNASKVVELAKNIIKLFLVGLVAYLTIKGELSRLAGLADCSVGQIFELLCTIIFKIGIRVALLLLILAIIDYFYQRYRQEQKLKMSKQEVKEERRQMEGDPQVKKRIRTLQLEMARRRMMEEVPKATVVVTNPTYIAIALKYEMKVDVAPKVLAKGKRKMAERIREIAKKHGIPIVEDKPLARGMYDLIEVGEQIPSQFFTPVAEILAYIYRLKKKAA